MSKQPTSFFRCVTALLTLFTAGTVLGLQSSQPLEYVESSSPLPGGGVVSSVYIPGQPGPTYNTRRDLTTNRETSHRQQASGHSVLDPGLPNRAAGQPTTAPRVAGGPGSVPQVVYQQPATVYQNPPLVYQQTPAPAGYRYQPGVAGTPAVATQVPSLGIPTRWNRSLRPNAAAWGSGPAVQVRGYGTVAPPAQTLPPAAAVPPTLGAPQGTLMVPPQRTAYTPVVQLQNFPPNVYAGQGIIGSPKLYVDGQPVRNLIRYLVIP